MGVLGVCVSAEAGALERGSSFLPSASLVPTSVWKPFSFLVLRSSPTSFLEVPPRIKYPFYP